MRASKRAPDFLKLSVTSQRYLAFRTLSTGFHDANPTAQRSDRTEPIRGGY